MKPSFKQIWNEFKAFAFKGNMLDLAVAVVIGAAFTGVINSLVKDIIMPSISYVTTAASEVKKTASEVTHKAEEKVGWRGPAAATQPSTPQPATPAAQPDPSSSAATPAAPSTDAQAVDFTWRIGRIQIGHFVAELINFVLIAFFVFILIVKVFGAVAARANLKSGPTDPATKECPECLSTIPYKATRCCQCTAVLPVNDPVPANDSAPPSDRAGPSL